MKGSCVCGLINAGVKRLLQWTGSIESEATVTVTIPLGLQHSKFEAGYFAHVIKAVLCSISIEDHVNL